MSKQDRKPRRKIVVPPKNKQIDPHDVTVVPTLNSLVNDALAIMGNELTAYRQKTARGVTLDLKEARVVTGYLDALTRASKESREQARAEDLADLSNEELVQLAAQLAKDAPKVVSDRKDETADEADEDAGDGRDRK